MLSNRSSLHLRLCTFVDWVRTDKTKEQKIRDQADEIRRRIQKQATDDELVVRSMPWSGSFAKRTGIRRHLQGSTPIEGQDVDLPIVVSPETEGGEALDCLLQRFDGYLSRSYPETARSITKSSVRLDFVKSKLSFDIVPMLATEDPRRQVLIRSSGERRETSVQMHIDFIKARSRESRSTKGRVCFNEMVRLLKWWREVQCAGDISSYPSILLDQLAAHAFREVGVFETYPETLARWFSFLAHEVACRKPIHFDDFVTWGGPPQGETWAVIDPVTADNNVAERLSDIEIEVLGGWIESARDDVLQAISADYDDDERGAIDALVPVFGNHVLHNS